MKLNSRIIKLIFLLPVIFLTIQYNTHLFAADLTGKEIVKRADDLMRGNSLEGRYNMTVTTPDWSRKLELDVWESSRTKTFIRILSPAKEAGTTTLRIKENMWNYIPNVERTIKIPPSMMLQPWMGSDFANDDLVKESSIVDDYDHTIIAEEDIAGEHSYKIQMIPKPGAGVVWGKIIYCIRKDDFVPLREEYYKENGELIKVLEYSGIKKMSDRSIPTIWKMTPLKKEGHNTVIEVVNVVYDAAIDETIFSMENLKRTR
jgi:outer membrane lipoprotein-sorting protein